MNNKNIFLYLFCILLLASCKNENPINIPVTSTAVSTVLKNFPENQLHQTSTVREFYQTRDFAPAWNDEGLRAAFMQALAKAGREGLFVEDYHGKEILDLLEKPDAGAKLEILFTDAFLEYAHDLYYGKLDPKKLHGIWGVERERIDLEKTLEDAVNNKTIKKSLSSLKPQNEIYAGLKKSLAHYEKIKSDSEEHVLIPESGEAIEPGKKDPRIPIVAARLKQLGVLDKNHAPTDSIYDKKLQAAVKKFQKVKGLATDEVLGNSTIQELNMDAQTRYDQILANLERWRWYPRDLGNHYVLVNIPNYKLAVIENGDTIRAHNVIAGDVAHHTPVFSDSIQYIVINPEWHIPRSIIVNEIIPKASSNPGYLTSRNIYMTDAGGNRVDPSTVNWSGGDAKNYSFTQGAGPSNALGRVKIIFPNKYAIYLHDTPAKAVFDQNIRAESHGCVRVENAVELVAYVVDRDGWDVERIKETIASAETKKVKVKQPILVHLFYWTAWNKNGETIFINDIYGLDKEIYTALKK